VNIDIAKAGVFDKCLVMRLATLILSGFIFLAGCASSDVQRDAASNMDMGRSNAQNLVDGATNGDIADSYRNASQSTKGAILGGTAGAVTGAMSSGVGAIAGTAVGAILGASYGGYIDSQTTLEDQLENRGATVVVLGDQILIVLPSSHLFQSMTGGRIKPSAYSTLDLVAHYINHQTKMLVKIAAYTSDLGPKSIDLAISKQQADSVARYFVASGIDARLLYAEGYGGTHLVDKNSLSWTASDNYRIEITLEKLYV
jgi:outer membrane protein OmpA-like peptidoglycan-associated protein